MQSRIRNAAVLSSLILMSWMRTAAAEAEWKVYRSEPYGFEMLVPEGTKFAEKEFRRNAGGVQAKNGVVELYALALKGRDTSIDKIQAVGQSIAGVAKRNWKLVGEANNQNGWTVYRAYIAQDGDVALYAGVGTGPKGTYLLMLKTTAEDVAKNEASYKAWQNSLKVF